MADYKQHLEKLIFEVYGAEEGAKKIDKLREAEDKHAKSLKGLKKQAIATARAEEKAAREAAEAVEKAADRKAKAQEKATAAMKAGALAALAFAAATVKAIQTAADQEAAFGRLERALGNTNAKYGEFSKAQTLIRENAVKYGLTIEEQADGLAQLADASGDAEKAQSDLNLAINIAAAEGKDLAFAVEVLRKARAGEVGELVNLNGFTKEQVELLGKMSGDADRGAEAIKRLAKTYKGAADETAGTNEKLKAWNTTANSALAVAGKLGIKLVDGLGAGLAYVSKEAAGADLSLQGVNASLDRMSKFVETGTLADYLAVAAAGTQEEKQAMIQAVIDKNKAAQRGKEVRKKYQQGIAFREGQTGNQVDEVPDYVPPPKKSGKAKKRGGTRRRKDGSIVELTDEMRNFAIGDFGTQEEADALKAHLERLREFEDEKKRIAADGARFRKQQADLEKKILDDKLAHAKKVAEEEKKARLAAALATSDAVAGGIQTLSEKFVKGEGTKALISGAVESARAIAAYAGGNIPGGIGHTAAAAAFFKVAADAGKGGGKGGGATAGGAGASAVASSQERDNVALIGEQGRSSDAFRRKGSYQLNIYTAFPPTPEHARQLADALESEGRNR